MTCDEILTSLWDAVARSEFLQGTRRRLQTLAGTDLVDLQAIG